jgi:hypothetical protein
VGKIPKALTNVWKLREINLELSWVIRNNSASARHRPWIEASGGSGLGP